MSIITKRGDDGETDAMYGGRLSKNAPGVLACGDVDELNAALGMLRVSEVPAEMVTQIDTVQGHLVALMGYCPCLHRSVISILQMGFLLSARKR